MAVPERDPIYTDDTTRTTYTRESNATGWFVGIIVALALLAIGYQVYSANSGPSTTSTTVNNTPAVQAPATEPAPMAPAVETTPMAPATTPAPAAPADAAPATTPAPAAPATSP